MIPSGYLPVLTGERNEGGSFRKRQAFFLSASLKTNSDNMGETMKICNAKDRILSLKTVPFLRQHLTPWTFPYMSHPYQGNTPLLGHYPTRNDQPDFFLSTFRTLHGLNFAVIEN
jgi:hypothetical protein